VREKLLAVYVWPLRLVIAEFIIALDEFLTLLNIRLRRLAR
jgi:hypothetical protein